uniref:Uncharacterized protein n=1 Tax=Ditylenchus dipsaci TaxID=166011 RepID=A0A915D2F6_9BILA
MVKSSATTQPAPVSSDLKQGVVQATPSTAPPSSTPALPPSSAPQSTATPQESEDERFKRRTRERVAKFKAATIEIHRFQLLSLRLRRKDDHQPSFAARWKAEMRLNWLRTLSS